MKVIDDGLNRCQQATRPYTLGYLMMNGRSLAERTEVGRYGRVCERNMEDSLQLYVFSLRSVGVTRTGVKMGIRASVDQSI